MKEGLEANHVKRHREEMRKMRKGMEAYHKKRMMEAVERARTEILKNGSTSGTNDAILNLSMPILMSESFNDKKIGMTGIERGYKEREEEKMMSATRDEVTKSVRDELFSTIQHRSEAMRKDNECLTREALDYMKDRYKDNISDLREGHVTDI